MSQESPCVKFRAQLRAFALQTLSEADQIATQRHLDACPDCAAALEAEIRALSTLDQLPDAEPSRDLTAAVMEQVRRESVPRRKSSRQRTVLKFVTVGSLVLIVALIFLPALSRTREAARGSSSANNLKQLGIVFKMFANENPGQLFPPITRYKGLWIFDLESVMPEYLSDENLLVDPQGAVELDDSQTINESIRDQLNALGYLDTDTAVDWEAKTRLASLNYTFIGWAVRDEEELAAVIAAMARNDDIPRGEREVFRGRESIFRLREGVERFLITDVNNPAASAPSRSEIPIMFERMDPENPRPYYNVLYLDGHVEAIRYGEKFPITERVARMLADSP